MKHDQLSPLFAKPKSDSDPDTGQDPKTGRDGKIEGKKDDPADCHRAPRLLCSACSIA